MNPIDHYIFSQKEPMQSIILHIRSFLKRHFPELEEKYRYKIPFYYYKGKPLCYLNVLKDKNYVDMGFWAGSQLPNQSGMLVARGRTMVWSLEFYELESINERLIKEVVDEAIQF